MADKEYEKLTVAKLREVFKERGIAATGLTKKQQLIDRLHEVDAEAQAKDDGNGVEEAVEPTQAAEQDASAPPEPEAAAEASAEPSGETHPSPSAETQTSAQPTTEDQGPGTVQAQPELPVEQPLTRSPSPRAAEEDSRKRKRRSPTPPAEEAAVAQKRQKQLDEAAVIPGDTAPVEVEVEDKSQDTATGDAAVSKQAVATDEESKIQEDVQEGLAAEATVAEVIEAKEGLAAEARVAEAVEVQEGLEEEAKVAEAIEAKESLPEQQEKAAEAAAATEQPAEQAEVAIQSQANGASPHDARFRRLATTLDRVQTGSEDVIEDDRDREIEPSRHAATSALYIRNLKRPIREGQLCDHLKQLAAPPAGTASDAEEIAVQIYLDSLRTHAFALLPSITHAIRVRSKLHDVVWPKEREREPLFVDFIREEQYDEFMREEEAGGRSGGMKRFEVVYAAGSEGETNAELRQQGSSSTGVGMPGAPTGPRQSSTANVDPLATRKRKAAEAPADTPSFSALGKMFSSTATKPKLYFQPVPQRLVEERLDELNRQSSKRPLGDEVGGGSSLPDSRRYTFEEKGWTEGRYVTEDGKGHNAYPGSGRLCDNGPEFGLKVPPEFRRRGGGFRGGRGRR